MIRLQRSKIADLQAATPNPAAVINALKSAVELEHATIPVYLYALYSLDPAKNAHIVSIIESVVLEEMLHMTLSSNVLNALGGDSVIDRPGFVPRYPGPLPGGVESALIVNLAPFSMAQLDTFLEIEQSEHPLEFPVLRAAPDDTITIGEFYDAISKAIGQLGDKAFVKPPRNQVGPDLMPEAIVVFDVASAQRAINVIVQQGEGTSTSPLEGIGGRLAHYYRFMQIKMGKTLIPMPGQNPPWAYAGAPIPFDESGVYSVPTNPALPPGYAPDTVQAFANDNFNYTYTSLLFALQALFSGDNTRDQMNRLIGLMMSLKGQAKAMMVGIPDPKVRTGPTFEYQTVNPRE